LTSKKYAKTIDLLCEGNKVFVKYQAQGEGFNPNPEFALNSLYIEYIFFIIQDFVATCACPDIIQDFEQLALVLKTEFPLKIFKPGEMPPTHLVSL